jgi:hypothetical protein
VASLGEWDNRATLQERLQMQSKRWLKVGAAYGRAIWPVDKSALLYGA